MKKLNVSIAVVALALVGLTGCATSGTGTTTAPSDTASPSASGSAAAGITSLMTADTSLGTIVVDDKGMTVYQFDSDTQNSGVSSCTGACLTTWPPVTADTTPALNGVTAEVATIKATDGSTQVTLNGWPLYHFSGDAAPGDTNGQGVETIWWVLTPDGTPITTVAPPGY
jgi:predicted lipoprotein with Yx(FWY)xxD motif